MSKWIDLPYGGRGARFDAEELKTHIEREGMGYIIQGQQACVLAAHTKPRSLDVWLRKQCARPDTKQAVNCVIEQLVSTGMFYPVRFTCPDSGRRCKGIAVRSYARAASPRTTPPSNRSTGGSGRNV